MEFSLYGQVRGDLSEGKAIIERCLRLKMAEHDSFYWGGQYYLYEDQEKIVRLIKNWDLIDNIPAEEQFEDYKILLMAESVNEIWPTEGISQAISPWFVLLKSE